MITSNNKAKKCETAAERTARTLRALQAAGVRAWREGLSLQASLDRVGKAWGQMQQLADDRDEAEAEEEAERVAEEEDAPGAEADITATTRPDRDGIPAGLPSAAMLIDIEGIAAEVTQEIAARTQCL